MWLITGCQQIVSKDAFLGRLSKFPISMIIGNKKVPQGQNRIDSVFCDWIIIHSHDFSLAFSFQCQSAQTSGYCCCKISQETSFSGRIEHIMVPENFSGRFRSNIVIVSVVFGPVYRYHAVMCVIYTSRSHSVTTVHSLIPQTTTNACRCTLCHILFWIFTPNFTLIVPSLPLLVLSTNIG